MVKPPQSRTLLKIKLFNSLKNNMECLDTKIQNSSNQLAMVSKFFQLVVNEMKQTNLNDFFADQPTVQDNLVHFNELITSFLNDFSTLTAKNEKLAEYLEKAKQEATVSKLDGKLKNISLSDLAIDENNYELVFPQIPLKSGIPVHIAYINSPSDFYVHPYSGVPEFVLKVQAAQQELIDKDIRSLPKLAPGMFVAARYSEDHYWYRAKIIDVTGDKVKVFYFDFGNIEVLDPSRIMPLAKSISDEKVQAVACHFVHYKPNGGWRQEAIDVFKQKVKEEGTIKCYFNEDAPRIDEVGTYPFYPVELFKQDGSSILEDIVKSK
ncbi:uncharacterized protein LOC107368572 [Tetranychus urticae]|uniref:Tudor domain-containing protein n=1 Tax=Tetranychus urticae TaxID=32264 RepID=T1KYW5_TETUR|nr:uncharacterized protein LOC107368572 [Tetranychus urticae]